MRRSLIPLVLAALVAGTFIPQALANQRGAAEGSEEPLFELLPSGSTGVAFENRLVENANVNWFKYQYLYNGGGVAIGDVDNDGRPDLYFTGTQVPDRLYLNKGNLTFADISQRAGISGHGGLKAGVTMADVNADGFLDIYVCRSGWYREPALRTNLLFINRGDGTFRESAAEYGLADPGYSVQSIFFDYDRDGDLDMLLTNHPIAFKQKLRDRLANAKNPSEDVRDKLYRNDGDGSFTEVSREAGIITYGHGLGPAVGDLNGDGWPDIYIANDFQTPDYYFVNNRDGTFVESLKEFFPHSSYFAMGSDIADINNDGLLDVMEVEMLPDDRKRQKTNMASMDPERFWAFVKYGYHFQYMRNGLHLNNGNGYFSDIAEFSGVTHTDWSWAALLADYDNDGLKDLLITNGYLSDTQDRDFAKRANDLAGRFSGRLTFEQVYPLLQSTRLPNYVFQNTDGLRFEDRSKDWGFDFTGYSNGAAYGDLDEDGDLDVVVNNFNDPACVYRNRAADRGENGWLRVRLEGPGANPSGIGSRVTLYTSEGIQLQEFQPTRGFESSVEHAVHFGTGKSSLTKLVVRWPDGRTQELTNLVTNRLITVKHAEAVAGRAEKVSGRKLFADVSDASGAVFVHTENDYDDFEKELLLPHKLSHSGPKVAVADVNGDGMDDYFVAGAREQKSALYLQKSPGRFAEMAAQPWHAAVRSEDIGAHFFDADGDEAPDLYVVAGGNEVAPDSLQLRDRLYLNDGTGNFSDVTDDWLPDLRTSGSLATSADFDSDGDLDLFVGGRLVPGRYPVAPRSYLLRNTGRAFVDATTEVAPALTRPGLVTSATWTDFNEDGRPDLVAVGEWMPIMMLENMGGKLEDRTAALGLDQEVGWWFKVLEVDVDADGDPDYFLGNLGLNYKHKASAEEPFHIYTHDFDDSGTPDIVLGYSDQGESFPVRGRECVSEQISSIATDYPTYEGFGEASLQSLFGDLLGQALHYSATNFSTSVLLNLGNGRFELRGLPAPAQFAPVMGAVHADFNADGHTDIVAAGNWFVSEVETPRADAGAGVVLLGDGRGAFSAVPVHRSGFFANGDVRDLALIRTGDGRPPLILVTNNDGPVQYFSIDGAKPGN